MSIELATIVTHMQEEMGLNPLTLYCQFTGKPMGRMNQNEVESVIADSIDTDLETIADDLMIRCLASMRPSITWNVMRSDSLDKLARSRPTETLAYLLNRLFQPHDWLKLPMARRMNDLHQRIKLFDWLLETKFDLARIQYWLLEIDAKMNLTRQHCGSDAATLMADPTLFEDILSDWYDSCIKVYLRNQAHELNEQNWLKGNSLARPAFFRAFMEAKPETKTAQGKRLKTVEQKEIDQLFASIMDEAAKPTNADLKVAVATAKPAVGLTRIPAFLLKAKG